MIESNNRVDLSDWLNFEEKKFLEEVYNNLEKEFFEEKFLKQLRDSLMKNKDKIDFKYRAFVKKLIHKINAMVGIDNMVEIWKNWSLKLFWHEEFLFNWEEVYIYLRKDQLEWVDVFLDKGFNVVDSKIKINDWWHVKFYWKDWTVTEVYITRIKWEILNISGSTNYLYVTDLPVSSGNIELVDGREVEIPDYYLTPGKRKFLIELSNYSIEELMRHFSKEELRRIRNDVIDIKHSDGVGIDEKIREISKSILRRLNVILWDDGFKIGRDGILEVHWLKDLYHKWKVVNLQCNMDRLIWFEAYPVNRCLNCKDWKVHLYWDNWWYTEIYVKDHEIMWIDGDKEFIKEVTDIEINLSEKVLNKLEEYGIKYIDGDKMLYIQDIGRYIEFDENTYKAEWYLEGDKVIIKVYNKDNTVDTVVISRDSFKINWEELLFWRKDY